MLPGGRLHNTYRGQFDESGRVPLPGLVHVGDAVCTTNPTAGRGIALSLLQSRQLVRLLGDGSGGPGGRPLAFDAWCADNIRPWFDDHVYWDSRHPAPLGRRGRRRDRPLPSDLMLEATVADPSLMRVVGPYMAMEVLPASLDAVEPRAREIFAGGWRPAPPPGPTRDELAELVTAAVPA